MLAAHLLHAQDQFSSKIFSEAELLQVHVLCSVKRVRTLLLSCLPFLSSSSFSFCWAPALRCSSIFFSSSSRLWRARITAADMSSWRFWRLCRHSSSSSVSDDVLVGCCSERGGVGGCAGGCCCCPPDGGIGAGYGPRIWPCAFMGMRNWAGCPGGNPMGPRWSNGILCGGGWPGVPCHCLCWNDTTTSV